MGLRRGDDCDLPLEVFAWAVSCRPRLAIWEAAGAGVANFEVPASVAYPPVVLMWRCNAGFWWRRSITKSWPLGLRVIASSIAWFRKSSLSEARNARRR